MQAANRRAREVNGVKRDRTVAQGLGALSIALGLAEMLAPRLLGRVTGVGPRTKLLPLLGAREIASGLGILSKGQKSGWLWSRVGGDAMDLALLAMAFRLFPWRRGRIAWTIAAVSGVAFLDLWSSRRMSRAQPHERIIGETR